MFDTNIVIIGNVLTAPEWRRTGSGTLVANFRVASTARRIDRESGRWIDGNSLRVRVTCWRRLAEGVGASLTVGDPVIVSGRLYTRDWSDADGNPRVSYEMEAVAVGHDLARGKGRFYRRAAQPTSAVEDEQTDGLVRGEAAAQVSDEDVPVAYGDGVPDGEEPVLTAPVDEEDEESGIEISVEPLHPDPADEQNPAQVEAQTADEPAGQPDDRPADRPAGPGRRSRRTRREPVPA
ncbi:single-stranded DNA-binding protein [Mangrovihabitans endophyticus]|uniref:Single-stranded DNA-binding protein n=1 Tax=Mangrovihabitans endophyticus TaxID=1751298 RepID=A0A8J3C304_9ACTN|nr:single-stranded DNA-binding protein [Mangrovihabitans endophyticus]GGL02559.1 hypothetical protein GCM10012284_41430 [Mangrovihabitans endophyticus]